MATQQRDFPQEMRERRDIAPTGPRGVERADRPTLGRWPEWLAACALFGMALSQVYQRRVTMATLIAWLATLALTMYIGARGERRRVGLSLRRAEWLGLSVTLLFGLQQLARLSADLNHFHPDEFILAYTSYALPSVLRIDWFSDFPEVWTARFPALFHLLQKPFFLILGPTLEAMRVSIWPYYIGITGYALALGALLFSRRVGIAAAVVWMFLGANLYMASLGIQIIGSTFFYMAALYHFTAAVRVRTRFHAVLAGLFAACCYLIYPASYIALPVLGLIALPELWDAWRQFRRPGRVTEFRAVLPVVASSALVFTVGFAPFVLYAFHVRNFLTERAGQVNLFTGTWVKNDMQASALPIARLVMKQAWDMTRSLVTPGLSGNIGFNFGFQALMDRGTAAVAAMGLLVCLWRILRRRDRGAAAVLVAFFVPFVVDGILTMHPPPFHRISVLFPILALIIACPIGLAADLVERRSSVAASVLLVAALAVVVRWNIAHVDLMVTSEHNSRSNATVARWLDAHLLPGETFYVDANWSIGLVPEMMFRTDGRFRVMAEDWPQVLEHYAGGPMILFWPKPEQIEMLKQRFPENEVYYEIDGVLLDYSALFVGKPRSAVAPTRLASSTPAGRGVNMFEGGCGSGPGLLNGPVALASAPNGDVFIADTRNHRIQRYSAHGVYKGSFGERGRGPGQFDSPSGIVVDGSGQLYVSDSWNQRVLRLSPQGKLLADLKAPVYAPFGLAVSDGELFVANTGLANVLRLGADGTVLATWGQRGHGPGQFNDHTSAVAVKDKVYVADPMNARIEVFDRQGRYIKEWSVGEWQGTAWRWPQLLADARRGRIYASVPQQSEVIAFGLDGGRLGTIPVHTQDGKPLADATALAFGMGRDRLLVLDTAGCRVVPVSAATLAGH